MKQNHSVPSDMNWIHKLNINNDHYCHRMGMSGLRAAVRCLVMPVCVILPVMSLPPSKKRSRLASSHAIWVANLMESRCGGVLDGERTWQKEVALTCELSRWMRGLLKAGTGESPVDLWTRRGVRRRTWTRHDAASGPWTGVREVNKLRGGLPIYGGGGGSIGWRRCAGRTPSELGGVAAQNLAEGTERDRGGRFQGYALGARWYSGRSQWITGPSPC